MNNRIALSMIVAPKDAEADKLDRALRSTFQHVDGIFITITGENKKVEDVAKNYHAVVSHHAPYHTATEEESAWLEDALGWPSQMRPGDKMFLFDEARNFNMSQIPKEDYGWIFWMDADDIIEGGEKLRSMAEEAQKTGYEAVYFKYLYQTEYKDIDVCPGCGKKLDSPKVHINHVIIEHLRERLMRNNGAYKWIAPIHETLIEQRPTGKTEGRGIQVIHLSKMEDRIISLTRNLNNLELAIYKSKGKDPRHIYYLAKAYFDIGTTEYDDRALKLIYYYIFGEHKSGWPQERMQAWNYVAEIYKRRNQYEQALKAALGALEEYPEDPSTYLNLAVIHMLKQQWERALFWVKLAETVPQQQTTLVIAAKDQQARTLEVIYNCCINLSQIDKAWAAAVQLIELHPTHQGVRKAYDFVNELKIQRDLTKSLVQLADYLKRTGERPKIKALLAAAPRVVEQTPFYINLFQQNNPPRTWDKNEVVIYCGMGFTPWSPKIMDDPKDSFVGGSEEAVVRASQSLAKKGWKVTVYADPGNDEGDINGVTWLPYYKFNRADNFNILVAWRDIRFFDSDWKAKKTYLWAHDIQNPMEYTKERLDRITKVFFLSDWHRDNVPALIKEKVMLTSNGI